MGGGPRQDVPGAATRDCVPKRYAPMGGANGKAPNKMANAMRGAKGDDGKVDWEALMSAGGTSLSELGQWNGHLNGICVKYACGGCFDPECKADHCTHWDCPREWQTATAPKLRRCVDKLRGRNAAANANGSRG